MRDTYSYIIFLGFLLFLLCIPYILFIFYPPPDYMSNTCEELKIEIERAAYKNGGFSNLLKQMVKASLIKGC